MKPILTETLAIIVENICGADPLRAGRARPVVEARVLLANALLELRGYTEEETATAIGFDRCTIHHYKTLLADARHYGNNPAMLRRWDKLKKIVEQ